MYHVTRINPYIVSDTFNPIGATTSLGSMNNIYSAMQHDKLVLNAPIY